MLRLYPTVYILQDGNAQMEFTSVIFLKRNLYYPKLSGQAGNILRTFQDETFFYISVLCRMYLSLWLYHMCTYELCLMSGSPVDQAGYKV